MTKPIKRNLVYLRRIGRILAVLVILIGPVLVFFILNQGKQRYEDLPVLGMVPLEEMQCKDLFLKKQPILLFIVPHDTLVETARRFFLYLQKRTHCDQDMEIQFIGKTGVQGDSLNPFSVDSLDFLKRCLMIDTWKPYVFLLDDSGRIRSIHLYSTPEKRRRFEDELRLFLFHFRTKGEHLKKNRNFNSKWGDEKAFFHICQWKGPRRLLQGIYVGEGEEFGFKRVCPKSTRWACLY